MPDVTSLWTSFTWTTFHWVSSPKFIIPTFLAIGALALVPQMPKRVRRFGKLTAFLLVVYLVLSTLFVASLLVKGLTISLPTSTDERADAVVVLGRGEDLGNSRYELAVQLWREKRVRKNICYELLGSNVCEKSA